MSRTCAVCPEPVRENYTICKGCTRRTRIKLADQEANRQELLIAFAKDVRMTAPNDGSRGSDPGLAWAKLGEKYLDDITRNDTARRPYDHRAADLLREQHAVLVSWCLMLRDEQQAPEPANTVAAMACHVEAWLDRLALHEAAGELVAEFRDLEIRIMRVIDLPEFRTRITVGPCVVELDDGSPCTGEVEAIIPRDEGTRPAMRCKACRSEWMPEQWNRIGTLIMRRKAVA